MADIKINVQVVEGQAVAAMKGIETAAKGAEKQVANLNLSFKGVTAGAVAIGTTIGNFATKAIEQMGEAVSHLIVGGLELSAQIQNLTFKFQALLPATKDAKKFLEEINEFSDKSPFEFPELAEAAKTLLTFGVNSEHVMNTLKTLGDVATASGADIGSLSLAFGKAAETGVVTGRELNELRNNGIQIIQELAKELGISASQVKKFANDGKIDFKTFETALVSLTKEGGAAFDAMNKKALTLDGSQKKLHDSVEVLQKMFGDGLAPVVIMLRQSMTHLIEEVASFLKHTNAIDIAVKAAIIGFELFVDIGVILYNAFNGIKFVINELLAAMTFIPTFIVSKLIAPIELAIRAAAGLGSAFGINTKSLTDAADKVSEFRSAIQDVPKIFHETAMSIGTDMAKVTQDAAKFKTGVEDSYISLAQNMKAAAKGTAAAGGEIEKGLTDAQKESQQKRLEQEIKFNEAMLSEKNKALLAQQELIFLQDGKISDAEELALIEQQDRFTRELELQKERDLQKQIAQDIQFGVEQEKLIEHQNALAILQEQNAANQSTRDLAFQQKKLAQDSKFLKTQEDLAKAQKDRELKEQQAFFSAAISLSNTENKGLIAIGRASALAQLAIKTPEAVGSSFAFGARVGGPALGFTFGAIAAAAMAAQAAQIAGAKFANGGIVQGNSFSGDQVPARVNSGEMILNRQQQSNLFALANNGGGGSGGGQIIEVHTTVELDGEAVGRSVSRQVANGLQLGEVV